jgi:hypothetical protein
VKLFRHDLDALSGAYAVNAIDDEAERQRFERHLHRCRQCTAEVRDLNETATRLALSASRPPPPRMRDRVLTAISQTRQLPSIVDRRKPPGERWLKRPRAGGAGIGRLPLLAYSHAIVSVVVTIVLLIALIDARIQLDRARSRNEALAAVLSAPDSKAVTQTTSAGGRATLVYSLRQHAMIFTSQGLPTPPPGKIYQLWYIGPPQVRSAGLLPAGRAGRAGPFLASGLERGDKIGLTVEPTGGTRLPTTTPIVIITLHA